MHQVNGCLSYFDKVPDGFYLIHGMNPYIWTVCTDLQENGRIPSLESLKSVDPSIESSIEAILVDRRSDPSLKELQNRVHGISSGCINTKEVVDQLAKLVCNRMGWVLNTFYIPSFITFLFFWTFLINFFIVNTRGSATIGEDDFVSLWRESSDDLKECLGSVVVPLGSLSIGLCRHRALLFKVRCQICVMYYFPPRISLA